MNKPTAMARRRNIRGATVEDSCRALAAGVLFQAVSDATGPVAVYGGYGNADGRNSARDRIRHGARLWLEEATLEPWASLLGLAPEIIRGWWHALVDRQADSWDELTVRWTRRQWKRW